jgi:hypothetical protein
MDSIRNLALLFPEVLQAVRGQGLPSLWVSLLAALVLAVAGWAGAVHFAGLWNRRYRVRLWQHALCAVAALVTLVAVPAWTGTSYVRGAARAVDQLWQERLAADDWQQRAFALAFEAVRDLGLEDFTGIAPPGSGESRIPLTHPASVEAVAAVYASTAALALRDQYPRLGALLQGAQEGGFEPLSGERGLTESAPVAFAFARTAQQTVSGVGTGLHVSAEAWVTKMRLLLVVLLLGAQALAFGTIGLAAYRDIHVNA